MTLPQFEATVTLTPANRWDCGGIELFEATVTTMEEVAPDLVEEPAVMSFTTTVPRQVGLAGSSAIVTAALRALADRVGSSWDPVELAKTAWYVETEVLGWVAGPQDRVVQAYEGLVDMDFNQMWHAESYERLDPSALPPLFVAWNQSMGQPSTVAHAQVRQRWVDGDTEVVEVMHEFADLAASGRRSLDANAAAAEWPALLNRAFALRRSIWNITDIDEALVATGADLGAGVAFAGSGGAVVGCIADPTRMEMLATAYQGLGAGFAVITP